MKQRARRHRLQTRRRFWPWSHAKFSIEQFLEESQRTRKQIMEPMFHRFMDDMLQEVTGAFQVPKELLFIKPSAINKSSSEFINPLKDTNEQ